MARASLRSFKLKRAYDLAFSPNFKSVATVSRDVRLWDILSKKPLFSVHPLSHPSHLDFSPDSTRIAVKSTSGHIIVIDATSGETITDCANQVEGEGARLYFSPDGQFLVDASWGGKLTARLSKSGTIAFQEAVGGMVSGLTTTTDRTTFAYTISKRPASDREPPSETIVIRRWPFTANPPNLLPVSRCFITAVSLAPSGSRLALLYGAPPNTLEIIDLHSSRVTVATTVQLGGTGASLDWSLDECLLGCVERHQVSIFESGSLRRIHRIELPYASAVHFSPQCRVLGLASWEQGHVLDLAEIDTYKLHAKSI